MKQKIKHNKNKSKNQKQKQDTEIHFFLRPENTGIAGETVTFRRNRKKQVQ